MMEITPDKAKELVQLLIQLANFGFWIGAAIGGMVGTWVGVYIGYKIGSKTD